jgi:hypothetical protein
VKTRRRKVQQETDQTGGWNWNRAHGAQFPASYLEPRILGCCQEVFGRFRQSALAKGEKTDRPPRITITGPDGKELLSKVMEYG